MARRFQIGATRHAHARFDSSSLTQRIRGGREHATCPEWMISQCFAQIAAIAPAATLAIVLRRGI
jgi:hypothetical protein